MFGVILSRDTWNSNGTYLNFTIEAQPPMRIHCSRICSFFTVTSDDESCVDIWDRTLRLAISSAVPIKFCINAFKIMAIREYICSSFGKTRRLLRPVQPAYNKYIHGRNSEKV